MFLDARERAVIKKQILPRDRKQLFRLRDLLTEFHLQGFSPEKRNFETKKELCKEFLLTWHLQGKNCINNGLEGFCTFDS